MKKYYLTLQIDLIVVTDNIEKFLEEHNTPFISNEVEDQEIVSYQITDVK